MMGTPDFMAPEQLLSEHLGAPSPASDVFAVGVLFFEMLTGQRPLSGLIARGSSTSGFLERAMFYHQGGRLPHCGAIEASVPEVLDDLVARAVAIDPAERFADGGEMLDALELVKGELAPTRAHVLRDRPLPSDHDPTSKLVAPMDQLDSAVSGVSTIGERRVTEDLETEAVEADSDSHLRRVVPMPEAIPKAAVAGGVFVPPGGSLLDSDSLEVASTNPVRRAAGPPLPEPVEAPSEVLPTLATDTKAETVAGPPRRRRRLMVVVAAAIVLFGVGLGVAVTGIQRLVGGGGAASTPSGTFAPEDTASTFSPVYGDPEAVPTEGASNGPGATAAVQPVFVPVSSVPASAADGGVPRQDGGAAAAERAGGAGAVAPAPERRRRPRRRPHRTKRERPSGDEGGLIPFDQVGRGGGGTP